MTRYDRLRSQRRMAMVQVDVRVFGETIVKGIQNKLTTNGIPDNALFFAVEKNPQSQTFDFMYLHESFEKVQEGALIPTLDITVTRS